LLELQSLLWNLSIFRLVLGCNRFVSSMATRSRRISRSSTLITDTRASRDEVIRRPQRRGRSILVLMILLLLWSVCLGIGLAQATEGKSATKPTPPAVNSTPVKAIASADAAAIGTVDAVPPRYQLGQELYLEACATCHIGIPPQVMPSETWRVLLQDPQHYGVRIQPLVSPELQATWSYLSTYSRDLWKDEPVPYRVYQSRYFKALHPLVEFPNRQVKISSCATCHPGADKYDFRTLSSEWQNAP